MQVSAFWFAAAATDDDDNTNKDVHAFVDQYQHHVERESLRHQHGPLEPRGAALSDHWAIDS